MEENQNNTDNLLLQELINKVNKLEKKIEKLEKLEKLEKSNIEKLNNCQKRTTGIHTETNETGAECVNAEFQKKITLCEKQILEGDLWHAPNPALKEIKCNFRHKVCKQQPGYTDGTNCYCWIHSIMIQWEPYK